MNPLVLKRLRENLSSGISDTPTANTHGYRYVLQRSDGAMISNKTCWWTFDISEALEANEVLECYPEAVLLKTDDAREVIIGLMTSVLDAA